MLVVGVGVARSAGEEGDSCDDWRGYRGWARAALEGWWHDWCRLRQWIVVGCRSDGGKKSSGGSKMYLSVG